MDTKAQQAQNVADKAAFGVSVAEVDGEASERASEFEVWRDNIESLSAFVACVTQWRTVLGEARLIRLGLDYGGVKTVLWALKVKNPQAVFNDIRAMELAALEVFNAQPV